MRCAECCTRGLSEYNERMATDWITITEAVELSGYHPDHLRELIREGKIAATKKGNSWWVDKQALLAYLKAAKKSADKRRGPKIAKT